MKTFIRSLPVIIGIIILVLAVWIPNRPLSMATLPNATALEAYHIRSYFDYLQEAKRQNQPVPPPVPTGPKIGGYWIVDGPITSARPLVDRLNSLLADRGNYNDCSSYQGIFSPRCALRLKSSTEFLDVYIDGTGGLFALDECDLNGNVLKSSGIYGYRYEWGGHRASDWSRLTMDVSGIDKSQSGK